MAQYYCDCCNEIKEDDEVNGIWDDRLNERFILCKCCGSECSYYEEEEELDEEEWDEDEEEE